MCRDFRVLYTEYPEKAMAPHSSTLAWKIPWTEEPGRLQSMRSLRVGHDWATSLWLFTSCIGEGNGNPLQCSCLENPRDGGAWWAAIYGVTQSRTRLKWLSSSSSIQSIMSSAASDSFASSFPIQILLFLFLVWLLWLGLPVICWIEVMRVVILDLLLNSIGRLSTLHFWVLCWLWACHKWPLLCWDMFPLYQIWNTFFSWIDA